MKNCSKPLQILFVDDDSDESYLFNEALEQSGLDVQLECAINGNNLLKVLLERPSPDLVLMDINMPYKDGVEALIEIRKTPKLEKLPVVIYSTTKNGDRIEDCFQNGANLFIVKPNNFDGMVKVVETICTTDWNNHCTPAREAFVITGE